MRSHCSEVKADGWSGAPGEATYIRDLVDRVEIGCRMQGIETVIVDGDLGIVPDDNDEKILARHPEFAKDYDAFVTLHYDANVYSGKGGAFWDRGVRSSTPDLDERLALIVWDRFRVIEGAPAADHFERRNANTSAFYAFRLTSSQTPGAIFELGVGASGAPDHHWLREHIQDIADAVVLGLSEFGGIPLEEDDMDGDTVKNLIREMLGSEEGANLVREAILHQPNGYGPGLAAELDRRFAEVEVKSVVEAHLGVKDECLKPRA